MGEDEAGTLAALKSLRQDLIEPKLRQYHGRTVKLMGDGILMEFQSVTDAVTFAIEVQMAVQQRNDTVPETRRIVFRIGINIGDIIVEDGDIYGDGVNIAARLEGLCAPGGVLLSGHAYEQVKGKLDLDFETLGERRMKNIAEPVTIYAVRLDAKAARLVTPVSPPATAGRAKRPLTAVAAGMLAVALSGLAALYWWQPWIEKHQPVAIDRMALALPDRPSIAVLPFDNLSNDPEQEYFVDGLTEDLITDLSQISGLFVIARNSSFVYKDRHVEVRQVAEDLGVRYVLEGSVRRIDRQVRVNAQLIDAMTGGHVWADRFDRDLENIFAVQDAIIGEIVEALELHLTDKEQQQRQKGPGTDSLEAYDLVLRARKLLTRFDREASTKARDLLKRALEIDPAYAEASSLLGFFYFDEWRVWGQGRDRNLDKAEELAARAATLSPEDPSPHVLLAMVYHWRRQFDAARAPLDRALALAPQDSITLSNIGSVLTYEGRGEEARAALEQAIRQDPFHPPNYLEWLGNAYWLLADYEACVEVAERGVALDPDYVSLHVVLAICYASLGRQAEAREAGKEILRINPRFTRSAYASYVPYSDERILARRIEMLRIAGVPE